MAKRKFVLHVLEIVSFGFVYDFAKGLFTGEVAKEVAQRQFVPARLVPYTAFVLLALLGACIIMAIENAWMRPELSSPAEKLSPANPPRGIRQLNDSIWEFYSPEGPPALEIIFFHGLISDNDVNNAFWKTWRIKDEDHLIWPNEWLNEKGCFPDARMLSVSYTSVREYEEFDKGFDIYVMTEKLVPDLIYAGIGQKCPVLLVGHSVGGLVIKQLLLSAALITGHHAYNSGRREKVKKFLQNVKGLFYYSTPHDTTKILNSLPVDFLIGNPARRFLETLWSSMARINEQFQAIRSVEGREYDLSYLRTFALGEGLKTVYKAFHGFVVMEASAGHDVDGFSVHLGADHFTVCRAKNRDDVVIRRLRQFIYHTLHSFNIPYPVQSKIKEVGSYSKNLGDRAGDMKSVRVFPKVSLRRSKSLPV